MESTIQSILNQNYPNLELIIIDGGSTDNSVAIIKKYQDKINFWVSEKDAGQTQAINKGFKLATGDYVNWINSDDMLPPGALHILADTIQDNSGYDFYFGDYLAINEKDELLYLRKSAPFSKRSLLWGRQLSSQPAVFFRRQLLEEYGYLNEKQQFCMDTEFWIRASENGATFRQIKHILGITRTHEDAKTTKLQNILHNEHIEIVRHYQHLLFFQIGSRSENLYFFLMNRLWRLATAVKRMTYRGDFTFMSASKALKTITKVH